MPSYVTDSPIDAREYILRDLGDVRLSTSAQQMPMIERLRRIVPFEGFAFSGLDIEGCHIGRGVYLATNLPQAFTKLYQDERLRPTPWPPYSGKIIQSFGGMTSIAAI
jgi:hypothetical protein